MIGELYMRDASGPCPEESRPPRDALLVPCLPSLLHIDFFIVIRSVYSVCTLHSSTTSPWYAFAMAMSVFAEEGVVLFYAGVTSDHRRYLAVPPEIFYNITTR